MKRLLLLILLLSALGVVAGCGDDEDDGGGETPAAETNPAPDPAPADDQSDAKPRQPGECVEVAQPEPKPDGGEKKPASELTGEHTVTFETNCGSFTVDVDEQAGLTAASFVQLAENGFYEDTYFHRIAPGFVIQGGDPTGTGTGGPGYTTRDAPPGDATYPKYTVAMAKGGAEPPGTAGSQFFVMTGGSGLPPEYAIVGEVSDGKKVIDAIGQLGDPSEQPTQVVKIEKARVSEG